MEKLKIENPIPKRRLGRTGAEVTILGLGGEGVLRSQGRDKEAANLISAALDLGINYMESARAYGDSEAYLGASLKGRRDKVFLATKSHARDKKGALAHLEESLANLKTDYLDLWYLHDMRTEADIEAVTAPGGALDAFKEAKDRGLVKFIGVTGHEEPQVIKKCIEAFDFDVTLVPVNPAEPQYKCFLEEIVPAAGGKDVGIVGMKVYLRGRIEAPKKLLFNYALTQPIATAAIGCDNVEQLNENAEIASTFFTLKYREVQRLNEIISPYARELMYYKP
ncbi:MAG: aldo/keto reductase [Thermodesulfobacteriota bacterium]